MTTSPENRKSRTLNVLQALGQNKVANIYKKYQEQMDMQPLNVNLEYLKLQVRALFLEREEDIKVINDFLQQIEEKLNTIKQVTSEQELKKLKDLLSVFLQKLANTIECKQGINSYIIESIHLTVKSSNYIINKMLLVLKENTKQGSIEEFLKADLKTHFKKYIVAELNSLKDSTYKNELTLFINFLENKIKYNCFLEKNELDNLATIKAVAQHALT